LISPELAQRPGRLPELLMALITRARSCRLQFPVPNPPSSRDRTPSPGNPRQGGKIFARKWRFLLSQLAAAEVLPLGPRFPLPFFGLLTHVFQFLFSPQKIPIIDSESRNLFNYTPLGISKAVVRAHFQWLMRQWSREEEKYLKNHSSRVAEF